MEDLTIKYPGNRQTGLHNLFEITNKEKKKKEKKSTLEAFQMK